jgi:iron complex outermembrane recepter protein
MTTKRAPRGLGRSNLAFLLLITGWCINDHAASLERNSPQSPPSAGRDPSPAATPDTETTVPLAEVVVTARKVSERLQDVPISITAVSAETLKRSGAQTLADISREVPGLNVVTVGPGQNQIIIRGLSSSGGAPTAGFYIDDTPMDAMDPALFDLERVEVLRGPQGTLYGADSMGGTVRYVTRQPDLVATQHTVTAILSDTDGGGLNYEANGLLNEPLVSGRVAMRAVAFFRDQEGYIDRYPIDPNNYLGSLVGPVTRNVNIERTYGMRLGIKLRPSDAFSVTPSVWIQRTTLGAPFTFDDPPGSFANPIQTRDVTEPITDQLELYSVTIEANIQGLHVTASTSYRNRTFDAIEDNSKVIYFNLSPVPQSYVYPVPNDNYFANHVFTEEVRGSASVGSVHGLLGLFYSHQDNFSVFNQPIPPGYNAAFGTPFGDQLFFQGTDSNQEVQRAVYGEINVDVTQQLQATFGARVFSVTQYDYGVFTGVFNGGYFAAGGSSYDSGTNPKFELSYRLAPDLLSYATAAKGFRPGGPLPGLTGVICNADLAALGLSSLPTSFKADTLWSYELGAKTAWLDNRLTINGAIYYIDWSNIQQNISLPTCGLNFTGNFGTAFSEGGELEIHYEPTSTLRLTLGAAYNEAKLLSTVVGAQGGKGDPLESTPKWMGSVSAEYHRQFGNAGSAYARLDFSTTSHQYNNFTPTSIYYNRAGYSLANVRVGAKHEAWDAALFINNAFNKRAETALPLSYAIDLPTTRRVSLNRPRTIGLEIRFDL